MEHPDKFAKELQRLIASKDFKDEKELHAFLDTLIGKPLPAFGNRSPEDTAEEMVMDAFEMEPQEGLPLVMNALEIDPACILAYEYIGATQPYIQLALPFFAYGVALGKEKFKKLIKETKGELWYFSEARSFLRCMANYARALHDTGSKTQALKIYKEIVQLSTDDNMGVRYEYGLFLIAQEHHEEFAALDKQFKEHTAMPVFNRVLYTFTTQGPKKALTLLKKAKTLNKHIIPLLLASKPPEIIPEAYGRGDKDEALLYAGFAYEIWQQNKEAIQWLKENKKS